MAIVTWDTRPLILAASPLLLCRFPLLPAASQSRSRTRPMSRVFRPSVMMLQVLPVYAASTDHLCEAILQPSLANQR